VLKLDIRAHVRPDVSIEVDDVDAVYERALVKGAEIVHPITDEDWGLRRFFVRDPNGAVLSITEHRRRHRPRDGSQTGVGAPIAASPAGLGYRYRGLPIV
jgi:hypothetical protein